MKARTAFTMCALILGTVLARAQAPSSAFSAGPSSGGAVKDAPYFADVVTTYDRVLPSGEKLHGETRGRVYRDSQGRTRSEPDSVSPATTAQKFKFIFINDPVDHSVISLDPRTMTARLNTWRFPAAGATTATSRQTSPGQPPSVANPPKPASGVVAGPGAGATPTVAVSASGVGSPQAKTEDLGTREVEGLTATGTRITRTLPPAIGDTQPRTVVTTTWVSPDLKVALLIETDDAQAGHSSTKLVHVVRTEPDAALFQIPPGYVVTDNRPQKKGQD